MFVVVRDKQESNVVTKTFVVDDSGLPGDDDDDGVTDVSTYVDEENAALANHIYRAQPQVDTWHDTRCGSAPHNVKKVCVRVCVRVCACKCK